jgi:hypothetical protein
MSIRQQSGSADARLAALMEAMRAAGIPGEVQARDNLAVLLTSDPAPFADTERRRRALALAREHGFTHLAIEMAGGGNR